QAEDGIRGGHVTGVQTCALPIWRRCARAWCRRPALPPGFLAVRGAGTTLERTYALLRLLRQLDLDACLVGDEAAAGGTTGLWARSEERRVGKEGAVRLCPAPRQK